MATRVPRQASKTTAREVRNFTREVRNFTLEVPDFTAVLVSGRFPDAVSSQLTAMEPAWEVVIAS
jgi:hypothetical protein